LWRRFIKWNSFWLLGLFRDDINKKITEQVLSYGHLVFFKWRLLHTLSGSIAVAVLFVAILVSFLSPAVAEQRVVVEKATANVVDVGGCFYDSRDFDHIGFSARLFWLCRV
jgi:hypothetical protein